MSLTKDVWLPLISILAAAMMILFLVLSFGCMVVKRSPTGEFELVSFMRDSELDRLEAKMDANGRLKSLTIGGYKGQGQTAEAVHAAVSAAIAGFTSSLGLPSLPALPVPPVITVPPVVVDVPLVPVPP